MKPSLFALIDKHGVPIEPLLRRILERCERDEAFVADLDACNFQPAPMPSDEIDCLNPWLFVMAMNGGGSAFGLYLHPSAMVNGVAPWAYWEHEDDSIAFMAHDTDAFFRGLLAFTESWSRDGVVVGRVRSALTELGVRVDDQAVALDFDHQQEMAWRPPREDQLESVDTYLAMLERDPACAELGLLAHQMYQTDDRARRALSALYEQRGWQPPRTHVD